MPIIAKTTTYMTVGDQFREIRKRHKMTQKAVSEQLGVNYYQYNKIERNVLPPTVLLIRKFTLFFEEEIKIKG